MELLTYKDDYLEHTYYIDPKGHEVSHGEFKAYDSSGVCWRNSFYYYGRLHGETITRNSAGEVISRVHYINGEQYSCVDMSQQEKLLFQIQHPGFRFIEE